MQIILASAKIMSVSIKREQSKLVCSVEREKRGMKSNDKIKSSPDISLSSPRFQNEADCFARDMIQYSVETIAEMLGRKEVRIVQPLFYVRKGSELKIQAVWAKTCRGAMTRFIIENCIDTPEDLLAFSYEGFTYEPKLGEPDFPHFIKQ